MKNHPFQPLFGKKGVALTEKSSPSIEEKVNQSLSEQKNSAAGPAAQEALRKPIEQKILVSNNSTLGQFATKNNLVILIILVILFFIAIFIYKQQQQERKILRLQRKLKRLM